MSYGNKKMTPARPAVKKKTTNKKKATNNKVPKGTHRMPDGSLMKNSAHKNRR